MKVRVLRQARGAALREESILERVVPVRAAAVGQDHRVPRRIALAELLPQHRVGLLVGEQRGLDDPRAARAHVPDLLLQRARRALLVERLAEALRGDLHRAQQHVEPLVVVRRAHEQRGDPARAVDAMRRVASQRQRVGMGPLLERPAVPCGAQQYGRCPQAQATHQRRFKTRSQGACRGPIHRGHELEAAAEP